jgi:hypothetical protein
MSGVLWAILGWGALGSVLLTTALVVLRALGVVDATRDREGRFKRLSAKGLIGFLTMLLLIVGFPAWGTLAVLDGGIPSFWAAWGVAYGIFFVINLYDLVILDYLVIVLWHPAFLKLPDTDYYRTLRPHAVGFVRGSVMGLLATLASAGLALVLA